MKTYSRRDWMKQVAASVAVSAAAPYVVPSSARGADGTVSPSERIVMGAIGIGGRGGYVMGAFMQNADVQMTTVCDARGDRRTRAKGNVDKHYGNSDCGTHIDFRELLARDDIDAVMIATGENWHAVLSIMAAKAGKDIYSEKPPTHTVAEGRVLADTIKRLGTIYQCGTQRRSIARFMYAADLARSGALGQLKTLRAEDGTTYGAAADTATDAATCFSQSRREYVFMVDLLLRDSPYGLAPKHSTFPPAIERYNRPRAATIPSKTGRCFRAYAASLPPSVIDTAHSRAPISR